MYREKCGRNDWKTCIMGSGLTIQTTIRLSQPTVDEKISFWLYRLVHLSNSNAYPQDSASSSTSPD